MDILVTFDAANVVDTQQGINADVVFEPITVYDKRTAITTADIITSAAADAQRAAASAAAAAESAATAEQFEIHVSVEDEDLQITLGGGA